MAAIISILIAALLDRYVQYVPGGQVIASCRSTSWMNTYIAKVASQLDKINIKQSYVIILSMFLPLCIGLFLTKLIFVYLLKNVGATLFFTLTLFYFLGNRDTEEHSTHFVLVHEAGFGVLFWFAVFGPTGALLYWFLVVSKQTAYANDPSNMNLRVSLLWLHALAAWIPVRITGFLYSLVGNFTPGFKCWLGCMQTPSMQSSKVLQDCGSAATDAATLGDDQNLVARAFVAWVVLCALIVAFKF